MMHVKSTLAVSAIILGGLVAASPFPYPRAPEAQPERVVRAVAPDLVEPAATAWIDPPARTLDRSETSAVARTADAAAAVPDLQAPVAATETPAAPVVASKPVDITAAKLAAKRAEQVKRRRLAQAARNRQAAQKQAAAQDGEREVASAAPAARPVDPIGDLLRGLGIGRQG